MFLKLQHGGASSGENHEERVYIRESIISLLLKLHSRFSGHEDSYQSPVITAGNNNNNKQLNK